MYLNFTSDICAFRSFRNATWLRSTVIRELSDVEDRPPPLLAGLRLDPPEDASIKYKDIAPFISPTRMKWPDRSKSQHVPESSKSPQPMLTRLARSQNNKNRSSPIVAAICLPRNGELSFLSFFLKLKIIYVYISGIF